MARKRNRQPGSRSSKRQLRPVEWVGGRLLAPMYVAEPEPYRPELLFWLELPDGCIVASSLSRPDDPPVSFARTLLQAMASPLVGPPRRPQRVRVSDPALAAELRRTVSDIEVVTAPTPELDQVLARMVESLPQEANLGSSYFAGGSVSEAAIASLFRAAERLFECAPWNVAEDTQVLRLDIPDLGIEGACVSIIGALAESLGLIIFPSLLAFESFLAAVDADLESAGPFDLGTSMLCLNFDRGAELPAAMRREAARHHWPVAGRNAYPTVQPRDPDGTPRPATEHDLRVVTACANALTAFFAKHRDLFQHDEFAPAYESIEVEPGLEVKITAPYDPSDRFIDSDAGLPLPDIATGRKVGRNSPCPCGSGRKYKKCCLNKDRAASRETRKPARLHELDRRLVREMMLFASEHCDEAWHRAGDYFDDPDQALALAVPWALNHAEVEGKPIARRFIEDRQRRLSDPERRWLEAQQAAWLSVWEVIGVDAGRGMDLKDLLTGEERRVVEKSASKTLVRRDAILARVVDQDEVSLLCGVHPRPLPPAESAEVVRLVRHRLRRKHLIPPDRMRPEKAGRHLISCWEEAILDLDLMRDMPPELRNTDDEDLVFTTEHFEFDPVERETIERQLASIEGVVPPHAEDRDPAYLFHRPGNKMHDDWAGTMIGRAEVGDGKLRLDTNSVERGQRLRALIEAACGPVIRHRVTEHADPTSRSSFDDDPAHDEVPDEASSAEAAALIRDYKRRHYADWVDEPLPALDGKTPREAVRTRSGREQVDTLVKQAENLETRLPEQQQFDFSGQRRELDLDD